MYRQQQKQYEVTFLSEQSDYSLKIACTTLNFFLFALSIGIFAVGVWLSVWTVDFNTISVIMNFDIYQASYILLIITGTLLIIVSFVGMCGSQQESVPQLLAFVIVVLLCSIMLISAAGLGIAFNSTLTNNLATNITLAISTMYGVNLGIARNQAVTAAIDQMQKTYSCCGASGISNGTTSWQLYLSSAWILTQDHRPPYVPASCCVLDNNGNPTNVALCQGSTIVANEPQPPVTANGRSNPYLNDRGCVTRMTASVNYFAMVVFGLGLGSFLYTILILVLSCYLIRRIEVAKYRLSKNQYTSSAKLQSSLPDLTVPTNKTSSNSSSGRRF